MKKKSIIEEKAARIQMRMREMQKELEQALIDYIEEFGEIDFTMSEDDVYTTLNMWGDIDSTIIEGVRVRNGVLLVAAYDGQEYDYEHWTNDTLVDICYNTDCWPTER